MTRRPSSLAPSRRALPVTNERTSRPPRHRSSGALMSVKAVEPAGCEDQSNETRCSGPLAMVRDAPLRYYHLGVLRSVPPPPKDHLLFGDEQSSVRGPAQASSSFLSGIDKARTLAAQLAETPTTSGGNRSAVAGFPPPRAQVVAEVERNRHFVFPKGPGTTRAGTDFSPHFAHRPDFSFAAPNHRFRPSSASDAVSILRRHLWFERRDEIGRWAPQPRASPTTDRPLSAASEGHSIETQPAAPTDLPATFFAASTTSEPGKLASSSTSSGQDGRLSPSLGATLTAKRSFDVVRAASASHATRLARLQRQLSASTAPLTAQEERELVHPNLVYFVA